jgi:hypothetical protein
MSDEPTEPGQSMLDRLLSLADARDGATPVTLEKYLDMTAPILQELGIVGEVPSGRLVVLLDRVLSGVAADARTQAIAKLDLVRKNDDKQFLPERHPAFQSAAAGELLGFADEMARERVRKIYYPNELEWDTRFRDRDYKGPRGRRRLYAGIWIGGQHPKNVGLKNKQRELLSAFESAVKLYATKRREELRSFVLDRTEPPRPQVDQALEPLTLPGQTSVVVDERPRQIRRSVDSQIGHLIQGFAGQVRRRMKNEQQWRIGNDPFSLPVRWSNAPELYVDHWENIHGIRGLTEPIALGRTRGDDIVSMFESIPSGRLVVLGRGGAGKTSFAGELVLALLDPERWSSADAVPVIFSLASWNPLVHQNIEDWIVGHLIAEYDGMKSKLDGKRNLAAALVEDGHILPVLDGFDEIKPDLRVAAIRALNSWLKRDCKVVVTSRPREYMDAIGVSRVLSRAAVIMLEDLTLDDIAAYLPLTTSRLDQERLDTTKWDPVIARLRSAPDDPQSEMLLNVLATPLMVSLARAVYSESPAEPMDLFRFPSAGSLSDHLLDQFVDVRYQHPLRSRIGKLRQSWNADDARRWLGFLAATIHAEGTRDIVWWRMRTSFGVALAYFNSLFVIAGSVLLSIAAQYDLQLEAAIGCACMAIALGVAAGSIRPVEPTTLRTKYRLHVKTSKGWLPTQFTVMTASIIPWFVLTAFPYLFRHGSSGLPTIVILLLVSILVSGPCFLAAMLCTTPSPDRNSDPRSALHADRSAALVSGSLYAISCGAFVTTYYIASNQKNSLVVLPLILIATMVATVLRSASFQWLAQFAWLVTQGRWPRKAMDFLEDAHTLGVLRQSGEIYQFRHSLLQDRLADQFILKESVRTKGSRTLLRARSYLAMARFESNVLSTAENELRAVLKAQLNTIGRLHSEITVTWMFLIEVLYKKGDFSRALDETRLLRTSKAYRSVSRLTHRSNSPVRIGIELFLADEYILRESTKHADLLNRMLMMLENELGAIHPYTVEVKADLLAIQDRLIHTRPTAVEDRHVGKLGSDG